MRLLVKPSVDSKMANQIDLAKGINDFVAKYGIDDTSKITGKKNNLVSLWLSGKSPQVSALQAMISHDPELFGIKEAEVKVEQIAPYQFPEGRKVAILMPSVRPIHIGVLKAIAALYEREKMQFFTVADNSYVRARNWCAQRLLDSGCEYGFWLDDDTVPPHGDVEYFRRLADNPQFPANFININPIARLIQTGKMLVGGCYFGRQPGGVAQFREAYVSTMVNDAAHSGPRNVVDPVGWVGFGCTLTHRKVFEDIINTQDVLVKNPQFSNRFGYSYNFFNYIDDESSEDTSFCVRAKQAGHQAFVDMAVMPIHVGTAGYSYHNTKRRPAPVINQ